MVSMRTALLLCDIEFSLKIGRPPFVSDLSATKLLELTMPPTAVITAVERALD